MSTLYNVYISGLQRENIHQKENVIENFFRQFPELAPQLKDLLCDSRERCFFSNVSAQGAQELQLSLSTLGLVCKYRPSENTLEQTFKLEPLEEELIDCPFCGHRQIKPAKLSGHRCASCGTKMTFFAKREKVQRNHSQISLNKFDLASPNTKSAISNTTAGLEVKHSAINQAKIITGERRRTRSLYGGILFFTLLGIITIAAFAWFQSSSLPVAEENRINYSPSKATSNPDSQTRKQLNSNISGLVQQKNIPITTIAQQIQQFAKKNQAADNIIELNTLIRSLNSKMPIEALTKESAAIHTLNEEQVKNIPEIHTLWLQDSLDNIHFPLPSTSATKANKPVQQITTKKVAELALQMINLQKHTNAETSLHAAAIAKVLAETPAKETAEALMKENLLLNTTPNLTESEALIDLPPSSADQIKAMLRLSDQVIRSNTGYSILDNLPVFEDSANTIDLFQLIYALDQIHKKQPALLTNSQLHNSLMAMDSKNLPPGFLPLINTAFFQNNPSGKQNIVAEILADQIKIWPSSLNMGLRENQAGTGLIPMALKLGLTAQ